MSCNGRSFSSCSIGESTDSNTSEVCGASIFVDPRDPTRQTSKPVSPIPLKYFSKFSPSPLRICETRKKLYVSNTLISKAQLVLYQQCEKVGMQSVLNNDTLSSSSTYANLQGLSS